jgi:hypothetical protein
MKRLGIFLSLAFICMTATSAYGQKGCDFNIVGTWKAATGGDSTTLLYRFAPEGTVSMLSAAGSGQSSELRETALTTYALDNAKSPKRISFTSRDGVGILPQGTTSMEITAHDDRSFTSVKPGSGPVRWVKVDPYRYFLVFAGRTRVFYDGGGPAFPMLIKTDRRQTQIDAVGIYAVGGSAAFGAIPAETYNQFMKEPGNDADVMLRLEITSVQYERSLEILRTWDRRARNSELLYVDLYLDNVLLVKQVSESLNQCGETVNLYKLDWGINDYISDKNLPARGPFLFFKEMRRRNEALHVGDDKFLERNPSIQQRAAQ